MMTQRFRTAALQEVLFDAFHRLDGAAPNNVSLIVAQRNFLAFGASDPMRRQFVRAITETDTRDPQWRRIDPKSDVFDSKGEFRSEDHIVRYSSEWARPLCGIGATTII